MTDLIEEWHARVGLDALNANPDLTDRVHDGRVPDGTDPALGYVLVYTSVQWTREGIGTSMSARQNTVTTTFTCHCVSETAAGARALGMQVRTSLLNLRPVIDGRNCGPVKQDDALPPTRDETTGRLVMDQVLTFSFISTG